MAIFFYFPIKDTTIYEEDTSKNTGKDEIIELTKITSGSTRREDSLAVYSETYNTRILLQFDYANLNTMISTGTIPVFDTGSIASSSAFLKLHVSREEAITDIETVNVNPISMSGGQNWTEGQGRDKSINESGQPISDIGASWTNSKLEGNQTWNTLTNSGQPLIKNNWATNSGGGTWHANDAYSGSQDLTTTSGDLSINITNGMGAHQTGTMVNDGWIVKRTDIGETNSGRYGSHKYFSIDTHTIYSPKLEVKWDDSSIEGTGSSATLSADDIVVYPKNNKGEYKKDSRERIRVAGRERYPTKTYATSSDYSTTNYLPATSYWGIKDMHTEEYVIDFDTTYTKLSCDANGNYFDLFMDGLQPERYYKFMFRVDRGTKKQFFDEDFAFKIVR